MEARLNYLFKKYLDNSCSRQELEEFFAFINKAEHDKLLRQLIKKVHHDLKVGESPTTHVDETGRLILTDAALNFPSPARLKDKTPKLSSILTRAAALITGIAIVWLLLGQIQGEKKSGTIASLTKKTSNRSESKFLLLEDSTQVWLNAASSLEFPDQFNGSKREVILSGEAYFDVKHAEKIPFIIHTGEVSTTVMGTAFNIKAYPGQKNITISVTKGTVRIRRKNDVLATLTKGQQLKVKDDGKDIKEKNIPVEAIAGWQQGNIVYDDETLEDIIADMQRVYNVNIQIDKTSIKQLGISTSFKREIGIEQALQVLCKLTDSEFTQRDGMYLIE